ncbi:cell division site-positioning protein MapZ family protein [Enterococcus quebecensis]|uniref:Zinc-ribbon domain-containing protein n=1 Tax=Enterococcus quebecensis TaxID=903983 RepID=A0A1E5H102_9ENTE|nr:cell division site-positioning protein MapZ family protein [Enterococcus quebecensis]OEG18601.1 hypothetical protein BCR23_13630 [Enterococcus quebecensis]OJG73025.1 hypothetical protein RV12_GL000802 [Enterococcus quebecensis]
MTNQCPNCGTEIDSQDEVCPKCGFSFENQQDNEETSAKTTIENDKNNEKEKSSSDFLNKDQNENIEWSELKDMSIGHVMTMFNEQQPEEKNNEQTENNKKEQVETEVTPTESPDNVEKESVSLDKETDKLADTAALNQYINEHKNDKPETIEKTPSETKTDIQQETPKETDVLSEVNHQVTTSAEQSESYDKGLDKVNPKEPENKTTESEKKDSEQMKKNMPKEEITKFTKPDDQIEETKTFGPKALPSSTTEIPSKSKKPEEIEMDAAPIFFKDPADEGKKTNNQFEKPTDKIVVKHESQKQSTNKDYKKMSIALAAVVILAGGSWFAYSQTQKNSKTEEQVAQKQDKLATQTEKELNSYFTDDKQLFLKPEMVGVSTKTIKENLDTLKNDSNYKNLDAVYKKVMDKQAAITKINELFAEPIIDGSKLKDVAIKVDKKVELTKRAEKDDFDKLINQAVEQATGQYDQLQKAKAAVDVFYKNNVLTDALTRETYVAAKTEVDKVKSEGLRKPLNDVLVKADKSLTDTENAVAQPSAANQTSAQTTTNDTVSDYQGNNTQTSNGSQPDSSTFSAPNAQGIYTDPVYSVNPSDVSDMSNPAWSWAPGVQEKVIATSIQRGYITAGAYSLQPARIINGEGYYNLYGADNQYLVTINAKTGWFKGNASRNAGR